MLEITCSARRRAEVRAGWLHEQAAFEQSIRRDCVDLVGVLVVRQRPRKRAVARHGAPSAAGQTLRYQSMPPFYLQDRLWSELRNGRGKCAGVILQILAVPGFAGGGTAPAREQNEAVLALSERGANHD